MVLVVPIYERCAVTLQRYNATVIISEQGQVIGLYRKNHIPQGKNEQAEFHERFYYSQGVSDAAVMVSRANGSLPPCFGTRTAQALASPSTSFPAASPAIGTFPCLRPPWAASACTRATIATLRALCAVWRQAERSCSSLPR